MSKVQVLDVCGRWLAAYFARRQDMLKLGLMLITGLLGINTIAKAYCEKNFEQNTLPLDHPVVQNFPCSSNGVARAAYLLRHGVRAYPIFFLVSERDRWISYTHGLLLARLLLAALTPVEFYARFLMRPLNGLQRLLVSIIHVVSSFQTAPQEPTQLAIWYLRTSPLIDVLATGLFQLGFWGEALYGTAAFVATTSLCLRWGRTHPQLGLQVPVMVLPQLCSTVVMLGIERWRLLRTRRRGQKRRSKEKEGLEATTAVGHWQDGWTDVAESSAGASGEGKDPWVTKQSWWSPPASPSKTKRLGKRRSSGAATTAAASDALCGCVSAAGPAASPRAASSPDIQAARAGAWETLPAATSAALPATAGETISLSGRSASPGWLPSWATALRPTAVIHRGPAARGTVSASNGCETGGPVSLAARTGSTEGTDVPELRGDGGVPAGELPTKVALVPSVVVGGGAPEAHAAQALEALPLPSFVACKSDSGTERVAAPGTAEGNHGHGQERSLLMQAPPDPDRSVESAVSANTSTLDEASIAALCPSAVSVLAPGATVSAPPVASSPDCTPMAPQTPSFSRALHGASGHAVQTTADALHFMDGHVTYPNSAAAAVASRGAPGGAPAPVAVAAVPVRAYRAFNRNSGGYPGRESQVLDMATRILYGGGAAVASSGSPWSLMPLPSPSPSPCGAYVRRTRLIQTRVKIRGVDPSDVTDGYQKRISEVLAAANLELEGVYLRPGCIELVVDTRSWTGGSEAASSQAALRRDASEDSIRPHSSRPGSHQSQPSTMRHGLHHLAVMHQHHHQHLGIAGSTGQSDLQSVGSGPYPAGGSKAPSTMSTSSTVTVTAAATTTVTAGLTVVSTGAGAAGAATALGALALLAEARSLLCGEGCAAGTPAPSSGAASFGVDVGELIRALGLPEESSLEYRTHVTEMGTPCEDPQASHPASTLGAPQLAWSPEVTPPGRWWAMEAAVAAAAAAQERAVGAGGGAVDVGQVTRRPNDPRADDTFAGYMSLSPGSTGSYPLGAGLPAVAYPAEPRMGSAYAGGAVDLELDSDLDPDLRPDPESTTTGEADASAGGLGATASVSSPQLLSVSPRVLLTRAPAADAAAVAIPAPPAEVMLLVSCPGEGRVPELVVRSHGSFLPVTLTSCMAISPPLSLGGASGPAGGPAGVVGAPAPPAAPASTASTLMCTVTIAQENLPAGPGLIVVEVRWPGELYGSVAPLLLVDDPGMVSELMAATDSWAGSPAELEDVLLDLASFLSHASRLAAAVPVVPVVAVRHRVLELGLHLLAWMDAVQGGGPHWSYTTARLRRDVAALGAASSLVEEVAEVDVPRSQIQDAVRIQDRTPREVVAVAAAAAAAVGGHANGHPGAAAGDRDDDVRQPDTRDRTARHVGTIGAMGFLPNSAGAAATDAAAGGEATERAVRAMPNTAGRAAALADALDGRTAEPRGQNLTQQPPQQRPQQHQDSRLQQDWWPQEQQETTEQPQQRDLVPPGNPWQTHEDLPPLAPLLPPPVPPRPAAPQMQMQTEPLLPAALVSGAARPNAPPQHAQSPTAAAAAAAAAVGPNSTAAAATIPRDSRTSRDTWWSAWAALMAAAAGIRVRSAPAGGRPGPRSPARGGRVSRFSSRTSGDGAGGAVSLSRFIARPRDALLQARVLYGRLREPGYRAFVAQYGAGIRHAMNVFMLGGFAVACGRAWLECPPNRVAEPLAERCSFALMLVPPVVCCLPCCITTLSRPLLSYAAWERLVKVLQVPQLLLYCAGGSLIGWLGFPPAEAVRSYQLGAAAFVGDGVVHFASTLVWPDTAVAIALIRMPVHMALWAAAGADYTLGWAVARAAAIAALSVATSLTCHIYLLGRFRRRQVAARGKAD